MKKNVIYILCFIFCIFFTKSSYAATLNVCPDATGGCQYTGAKGIQDAIEKATNGDTILVKPGNYVTTLPIVTDPNYKYQTCLVHTRGKNITIEGAGAVIDNQNGGLNDPTKATWSTGICVLGGTATINGISVKQTLRPALVVYDAQAIVKNFKTIDIDNATIDIASSQVIILNSILTGAGIGVRGNSYARIENNTLYGGAIALNLCNVTTTGYISNNVLARSGITATCPEQVQSNPDLIISNNIVYHGSPTGDQNCVTSGNTVGEICGGSELCNGTVFEWPGFVGADENGTVCVWGEGWIQGDFNTKTGSAATLAGAGISTGPCANGASAGCNTYLNTIPLPAKTEAPPATIINVKTTNPNPKTITVCPSGQSCDFSGAGQVVQEAVDKALDGDTILVKAGTYIRPDGSPLAEGNGNITCFVDLHGKDLTLKGEGNAIFFGEGHDKPDTYANRSGICSTGGDVTIDTIRVKEFQGGCLRFTDARLTLKNSIIEGCDSGGTHFRNVSLLAVNNYFVANIGIQPKGPAPIKAFNNTFYSSKAINTDCNVEVPPIDFVNNIVVDEELTIGAGWIYGDCPATAAQFKTKNIKYNLIWKGTYPCYENHEYCDNFTGKISADPLFVEPVIDQRGMAGWANFGFKDGSPAVGAGDPMIPGKRDLGISGGPCANPADAACANFINANKPPIPQNNNNQPINPANPAVPGQRNNGVNPFNMFNRKPGDYFGKNFVPQIFLKEKSIIQLPGMGLEKNLSKVKDFEMNLFMYCLLSIAVIMVMHFAFSIQNFNFFLIIAYFVLGGVIGLWFNSYWMGLSISLVLSLLFI